MLYLEFTTGLLIREGDHGSCHLKLGIKITTNVVLWIQRR